jgi:AraC-like DNA-binding protein/quercetin dioxygenase-like cupin family protein
MHYLSNFTHFTNYKDLFILVEIGDIKLNIINFVYQPSRYWYYPRHAHSGYELHFIPSGRGMLCTDTKTYDVLPKTIFLTGPGIYHSQEVDKADPMSEFCVYFEIKKSKKKQHRKYDYETAQSDRLCDLLNNPDFLYIENCLLDEAYFLRLIQELEMKEKGNYTIVKSLLTFIIMDSIDQLFGIKDIKSGLPLKTVSDKRRLIIEKFFLHCLDPNMVPVLTPGALAAAVNTSVRQLNRVMLLYFGMPFHKKLAALRAEKSADLLLNTDMNIKNITDKVRYDNANYFCKFFREYYSMSPTEYRQKNRQ